MTGEKIQLGNRMVGPGEPVFIICEGGVTNYGELELAKRQVDAAAAAAADIIKFQVTDTAALISRKAAKRLEPELGYDWFSRVKYKEFKSLNDIRELARYAATAGYPFFATAHEEVSLELIVREFDPPFLKVGSGEAHNWEFLKKIGGYGKPIIISFGLQTDDEILKAVETLKQSGAPAIAALHCTTLYPTPYEIADLPRMLHLHKLTGLPVGISDHSVGWHTVLGAVALGAVIVEKHVTFDKDDPRSLDNAGALLPREFKTMVSQIRELEKAMKPIPAEARKEKLGVGRDWAGQSLIAARNIPAGAVITREMITFKRPGKGGLSPSALDSMLGRRAKTAIEEDEQILEEHLE